VLDRSTRAIFALGLVAAACGETLSSPDAPDDAGLRAQDGTAGARPDATLHDAQREVGPSAPPEASSMRATDAGGPDVAGPDTGTPESGALDATADAHTGSDARDGAHDVSDACVSLGSVTFRMLPPSEDAAYAYIQSFGDPGDGYFWYSVATASGDKVRIFLANLPSTCSECANTPIPIGFLCASLLDAGVSATWSGVAITGQSTCRTSDDGLTISCADTTCMPAGPYVVTMCASGPGQSCDPSPTGSRTCVSVPFSFPTAIEVVGTLP